MSNSKYRCVGCHDYFPQPEHRRVGPSRFCSDSCAGTSSNIQPKRSLNDTSRRARPAPRGAGSPIPTTVRTDVRARDRSRCRFGGCPGAHLHHICYRSEGVDHQPHNLLTLCGAHHDLVHSNKRVWKPVLLALIWLEYVEGSHLTVIQTQRVLLRRGLSSV